MKSPHIIFTLSLLFPLCNCSDSAAIVSPFTDLAENCYLFLFFDSIENGEISKSPLFLVNLEAKNNKYYRAYKTDVISMSSPKVATWKMIRCFYHLVSLPTKQQEAYRNLEYIKWVYRIASKPINQYQTFERKRINQNEGDTKRSFPMQIVNYFVCILRDIDPMESQSILISKEYLNEPSDEGYWQTVVVYVEEKPKNDAQKWNIVDQYIFCLYCAAPGFHKLPALDIQSVTPTNISAFFKAHIIATDWEVSIDNRKTSKEFINIVVQNENIISKSDKEALKIVDFKPDVGNFRYAFAVNMLRLLFRLSSSSIEHIWRNSQQMRIDRDTPSVKLIIGTYTRHLSSLHFIQLGEKRLVNFK